jgi:Sulfotransferase family
VEIQEMSRNMIFIIGSPRSGSTLLERMISSHSQVQGGPEPHLITPLAHLGYYDAVDKAPYDHLRAVEAQRQFVSGLPGGESDYLDALKAYCNVLYGRALKPSGKAYYLDKTPAYALVLPFLSKVFPQAKYVVLTRHPGAIFSSYADSFFEGDWAAAHEFNPIVERYVPAIARFLREDAVPLAHVRYEDLVKDPESHMKRICETLELPFEPGMIDYGQKKREQKGLGDPFGVGAHQRPVTSSVAKWVKSVAGDAGKEKRFRGMIASCLPEDLETWGFSLETVFEPLDSAEVESKPGRKKTKRKLNQFRVERIILRRIRRNIHKNALGRLVRRIRFACDVLLR